MDLQNVIIALQDQVIALEEKLTELTKLRETDIAIANERNNMMQAQISELQKELKASKTLPFPMPEPAYPSMPSLGTGSPFPPPWTTTIATDVEKITATTTADGCYVLSNGVDPISKLR